MPSSVRPQKLFESDLLSGIHAFHPFREQRSIIWVVAMHENGEVGGSEESFFRTQLLQGVFDF